MATEFKLPYTANEISDKLGRIDDLAKKTEIPNKISQLVNDSGFINGYTETDPTVPEWAKAATKPAYNANEIGGMEDYIEKHKISLGLHTDGLLYIFVDGALVGEGIALQGGAIGDVIGTLDENNNIILTGDLADGTYTLKYENADGTYSEIGSLVVAEAPEEPTYTNFAVPTDSSTQADWEAGNWCNESFIGGSSYGYRAAAGTSRVTTNTFAVENGDTIYVKGINYSTDVSTQTQVALLDADGERIYHGKIDTVANNQYITEVVGTEGEDYFSFKNCNTNEGDWGTRFIRLAGFLSGTAADVIITRNQPIG